MKPTEPNNMPAYASVRGSLGLCTPDLDGYADSIQASSYLYPHNQRFKSALKQVPAALVADIIISRVRSFEVVHNS